MSVKKIFCFVVGFAALTAGAARAGVVEIRQNQLWVDGVAQPQLFGAELQYFRLRGGSGPNVPRERVVELWTRAIDHMVAAKMNAVSFYIPWDFHEYTEGKFDFRGEVDEDGDGNADYPSRDLFTFFRLLEERGIRHIMVRPGPYINAEWGFLGFGAIPLWFHEKYPDSHMRAPNGTRTKLYDYFSEDLHRHTRLWFAALYREVLSHYIGAGKPVSFLQLDNETNFMWQSIYNHDHGPGARARYREFLKQRYEGNLASVNAEHGSQWTDWEAIMPPAGPVAGKPARDWYEFQDETIHAYLKKIRSYWEELGVREPTVLFTLAESYNASDFGLLPHYRFRNDPGATGMMTVNLYPKTWDASASPLFNQPFKSDHDVMSAEAATDYYLGRREEWVLGPEIQGGWWRGTNVAPEARRQTYLSTMGHGLKALFVYYFNEGNNWQSAWQKEAVRPHYEKLRADERYSAFPENALPGEFWRELQTIIDTQVLGGIPVHHVWHEDQALAADLYFDAPLDKDANPRRHYFDIKEMGEKLIAPYGVFLGKAVAVEDRVCVVRDDAQHLPSPLALNNVLVNGEWSAALIGYLQQTGAKPRIVFWDLGQRDRLDDCDIFFLQDTGRVNPELAAALGERVRKGATVVNFLGDSLAKELGVLVRERGMVTGHGREWVRFGDSVVSAFSGFLAQYDLAAEQRCRGLMFTMASEVVGYECKLENGQFIQIGTTIYNRYNSGDYGLLADSPTRVKFLRYAFALSGFVPRLAFAATSDRTTAFARTVDGSSYWIAVKTGNPAGTITKLRMTDVEAEKSYRVTDLFSQATKDISGAELREQGLTVMLPGNGSTVYFLESSATH